MNPIDDAELLRRYALERSEAAFAALVEQHLGAVYGVALRQAHGDTHLAEDMGMVPFSFAGKTLYGNTGGSFSSGAWLAYYPEEKLALAYATNMKIYPVVNIVSGIFDIYWNRPFAIPTFDAVEVSPEVLDRYVGVYSTPDAPVKLTITRRGTTLNFQPPGQSAVSLEATDQDKFKIDPAVFFEFDAAKNQMIVKRRGGERVFTKEK